MPARLMEFRRLRGLPILIRLARQRADARRIALAEAERQTGLAIGALAAHDARDASEAALARREATQMAAWAGWARQSQRRRAGLERAVEQLRADEEAVRAELREAFAETKRLEIAAETAARAMRLQEARKAERAAEDAELLRRR